ncbi:IS66 family insertion sequence element accessory protein TnpA [Rhodoferax ferrireducens]|uniref:IS66 family insertion sequence element accessory protein TnpA n=1 Tax=Rhodoferax ferrireducens TaxID=192843 RepID=UPI0013006E15|nr:hypothetical protein [Rhodoferax ferrireducens]
MKNAREYWSNQLSAIKTQGVSCSAYAKQHDLSLASLYYWQRRLQPGTFIVPGRLQSDRPAFSPSASL